MKKIISLDNFREEFINYNRGNQFSYEGLEALYNWLEEIIPDYELDVIGLCCEFTEYKDLEDIKSNYDNIETEEDLYDVTSVIKVENGGYIIQNY